MFAEQNDDEETATRLTRGRVACQSRLVGGAISWAVPGT